MDPSNSTSNTSKNNNTNLIELGSQNFENTIKGSKPVLVDFWATWCGPCQFMLPIFDKLAKKYMGKVVFGRLNVDDNQSISSKYNVYAIPTFILLKDGKEIDRAVGAVNESGLESILQRYQ